MKKQTRFVLKKTASDLAHDIINRELPLSIGNTYDDHREMHKHYPRAVRMAAKGFSKSKNQSSSSAATRLSATAYEKRPRNALPKSMAFTRADSRHSSCRTKTKTFKALVDSRTVGGGRKLLRKRPKRYKQANYQRRQYC